MTRPNKSRQLQVVLDLGFDRSNWRLGAISVKCSQCEALVINGVPCHERGCPNERMTRPQGDGDDA